MSALPLWRRCRTLANALRLDMLDLLSDSGVRCVKEIADTMAITEDVASKNLQLLASSGFIRRKYGGKFLYYAIARQDVLLTEVLAYGAGQNRLMFVVTALTHERRVAILNALGSGPLKFEMLCGKTGIPQITMRRHMDKLVRRGFVGEESEEWILSPPACSLQEKLVELASEEFTLAQV